eukprot:10877637-Ditylum_brightwellii.AAC.1
MHEYYQCYHMTDLVLFVIDSKTTEDETYKQYALVDAFDLEEVEEEANQLLGLNVPGERLVQKETIVEERKDFNNMLLDLRVRLDAL